AEGAGGAESPGQLELLRREAVRGLVLAERKMGKRGPRSPGEIARAGDRRTRQERADCQEVCEPRGNAALCNPQPRAGEANLSGDHRSALGIGVERRER